MGTSNEHLQTLRPILAHLSPLLDGGLHSVFSYENYIPWAPQMFTGNLNMDQLKVLSFNYLGNCWQVLPVEEQAAQLDATINFFMNWLTSPGTGPRLYITYMHPTLFQQIATAVQQVSFKLLTFSLHFSTGLLCCKTPIHFRAQTGTFQSLP